MYTYWKKKSPQEIRERVFQALAENVDYRESNILGIPASYLDEKVFNQDATFLSNAPYISTLVQNPNHIGCHTLGKSESFFRGTQEIERELIEICAVDILKAKQGTIDGYVASGGTEANIQAIWVYRNYFMQSQKASRDEIALLCSVDSHYSMNKAANLLGLDLYHIDFPEGSREWSEEHIRMAVEKAKQEQRKYFIVVCNMMTTMFGSVDPIDPMLAVLEESGCEFKLHVDGAYGGFYYPFTDPDSRLSFENPAISSFTLDAHKMAQAPYGTGIFLIRKEHIQYVNTAEASYVEGQDFTLIGSRSGANSVAVWMILMKNGPYGWQEKVFILQKRAEWMCEQLQSMGIVFYRHACSNIITIDQNYVPVEVASRFGLVPDNHSKPNWFKIVIMEHVTVEKLQLLLDSLKQPE
ncbi:MAG: aspartate aminotransferase family protein [Bacteroidetes bacterium]|nr:MAG: aspartate aminotransferase family protein [Bacteroidota bacterium]